MYTIAGIGIAQYEARSFMHRHSGWELVYMTEGNGSIEINGQTYPFARHTLFCIPPGSLHCEYAEGNFQIAYFSIEPFFNLERQVHQYRDTANQDFLQIFMQVYRLFQIKPSHWTLISHSLLEALEQYLLSWSESNSKNPYVERFEHILFSSIPVFTANIKELLKEIPMSGSQFRKLFKAETGKTPAAYLTDLRITLATQLLLTRAMPVKAVAYSVGFQDPYYFCRAFKRKMGLSPSKWRQCQSGTTPPVPIPCRHEKNTTE